MRTRHRRQRAVRRRVVSVRARRWGLLLVLILPLLGLPAMGRAQEPNRAGVVVRTGDGQVHTACVAFTEPAISGLALLERSGLDVVVQTSGGNAAVCSIAGEGCNFPQQACFCQCQGGGTCRYWAYWHLNGGIWQYSSTGAAAYRVPPGGVDGWAWGDGNVNAGSRPPAVSFDKICPLLEPAQPQQKAEGRRQRAESTATPQGTITRPQQTADGSSQHATSTTKVAASSLGTASATSTAQPSTAPMATPAAAGTSAGGSNAGRYLLFGGTLGTLLMAIALAWRRRR